MGYYLAIAYRYSSILMSVLLVYFLANIFYLLYGGSGLVVYILGWVGALQLLFLLYWLIGSNMLIFLSGRLVKQFSLTKVEEALDENLVNSEPTEFVVFPGAKFWTISMIVIGGLGIYSAAWFIEDVQRIPMEEQLLGKLIYIFVIIHSLLMIFHAFWILYVLTKDGAWTRGEYQRR